MLTSYDSAVSAKRKRLSRSSPSCTRCAWSVLPSSAGCCRRSCVSHVRLTTSFYAARTLLLFRKWMMTSSIVGMCRRSCHKDGIESIAALKVFPLHRGSAADILDDEDVRRHADCRTCSTAAAAKRAAASGEANRSECVMRAL